MSHSHRRFPVRRQTDEQRRLHSVFHRSWVNVLGRAMSEDILDFFARHPGARLSQLTQDGPLARRWGGALELEQAVADLIALGSLRENHGRLFSAEQLRGARHR